MVKNSLDKHIEHFDEFQWSLPVCIVGSETF